MMQHINSNSWSIPVAAKGCLEVLIAEHINGPRDNGSCIVACLQSRSKHCKAAVHKHRNIAHNMHEMAWQLVTRQTIFCKLHLDESNQSGIFAC